VRVIDGVLKKGPAIRMMGGQRRLPVDRVGVFTPKLETVAELGPGRDRLHHRADQGSRRRAVGDTITDDKRPAAEAAARASRKCSRWCSAACSRSMPPTFEKLRDAIGKLRLNDASFSFEMETSAALGFGFRCGFLGLLHLEIIQERLEREFDLDLITTAPSVVYKIMPRDGDASIELHNPADMPDPMQDREIEEPWIKATI
jgi:GTP-binding protein LepA